MNVANKTPSSVGILGAGSWGTVLAILASHKIKNIYLYDHNPKRAMKIEQCRENTRYLPGFSLPQNIHVTNELSTVMEKCTLILPVVPSTVFRDFAKQWAPFSRRHHLCVHGTKGLEPVTHKRMSEIILEETACQSVGVLSGPNLALELAQGKPAGTVVASPFDHVIEACQVTLSSTNLRVYGNSDLIGVEWIGALKNILALAAGVLDEFKLGQNAFALVLTRGMAEISRIIFSMGAQSKTLLSLAGIGDILATCTSPLSRNFQSGQLLAKGKTRSEIEKILSLTVEGFSILQVAYEIGLKKKLNLPIITALWQIVYKRKSVKQVIQDLMSRPTTLEFLTDSI